MSLFVYGNEKITCAVDIIITTYIVISDYCGSKLLPTSPIGFKEWGSRVYDVALFHRKKHNVLVIVDALNRSHLQ